MYPLPTAGRQVNDFAVKSRPTMMASDDNTSDIAGAGKDDVDEFGKTQTVALERFHAAHRRWFDLWQAEASLLVDFGDKLAHARSIPEVRKIYQDTTVQLKIATKDAKRVIDDNEAAARDIVQLFTNGWTTQPAAREEVLQKQLDPVSLLHEGRHRRRKLAILVEQARALITERFD
jgi:hypothetical protein